MVAQDRWRAERRALTQCARGAVRRDAGGAAGSVDIARGRGDGGRGADEKGEGVAQHRAY